MVLSWELGTEMTKLIRNQQHLAAWVREQRGPLDLAVAFWGAGAIEELGLDRRAGKFRILLDLSAGATNPKVVKALLKLAPEGVKCVPRLHAKAFIARDSMMVGSANASANGLGSEGTEAQRWRELGVLCDDAPAVADARAWFNDLWISAESISSGMLKKATVAWNLRQKARPRDAAAETNILAAAVADPDRFSNLGWFVVVTSRDLSKQGKEDAAALEEETNHPVHCWENWPDIPTDAKLICFSNYPGQALIKDELGVFYSPTERRKHRNLVLVEPSKLLDEITGQTFALDRITQWRPALERAKTSIGKAKWKSQGGMCMDLGEFARRFGQG